MVLARVTLPRYFSLRFINRYVCAMNQAYLRHLTDSETFELTFQYVDPNARLNRQFNFSRQVTEPVSTFTQRVATNIEKIVKKKSKTGPPVGVRVSVSVNGAPVADDTTLCKDIFSDSGNKVVLNVCEQEFKVVINSPWISGVVLPSSILAGFPVYPMKFDSIYTDKAQSEFNWYKSNDRNKWSLVGGGFVYTTSNSDIGAYLKLSCVPKNGDLVGPIAETVSSVPVQAGPGFCPFETRHQFTKEKCSGSTFRVVSYNILADLYCDSDFTRQVLHPYCPPYALAIDYRKQLFIKEITGYNGDIICLQEVDRKVYNYDLRPLFEELGYESDFCIKRGAVAEGLACFYNKQRFKCLQTRRFVLSDELKNFSDIWAKISENDKLSERILDRSTVLQVNFLESVENNEVLVVGNTHLYFHPDADHIRLLQGAVIIKYLEHLIDEFRKKMENKRLSLILCGDFNSTPECGIYQLYTTGHVSEDHIDFQSNLEEAVKVPLHQNLRLSSACGTPKYTNFTAGFADCLDYIYYESGSFDVVQVVPLPSEDELRQHTALPSVVFPSDHISLISDLKWK
ncbi:2',5'-phosphodiesterase 12 [Tribolium madens]|uniref:2',5'-phosphodiesterase 12 n=1 Tax=Tribolium madens TaxID=41895 RepID=UPI001CF720ED|nr:2',5'-phosphodiesterase 12 [Tribolium madens]